MLMKIIYGMQFMYNKGIDYGILVQSEGYGYARYSAF